MPTYVWTAPHATPTETAAELGTMGYQKVTNKPQATSFILLSLAIIWMELEVIVLSDKPGGTGR